MEGKFFPGQSLEHPNFLSLPPEFTIHVARLLQVFPNPKDALVVPPPASDTPMALI